MSKAQTGSETKPSDEMLNLFVRLEVQRRYFSIVTMEMISMTFGMKEPSSLEALLSSDRTVSLD